MSKEIEESVGNATISGKEMIVYGLLIVLLAAVLGNIYLSINLNNTVAKQTTAIAGLAALPASGNSVTGNVTAAASNDKLIAQTIEEVIPTGVPAIYGAELGISFDKAAESIAPMSNIDKTVTLQGDELQRYVSIASQTACEYCCGATTLVTPSGEPACGCEHSYAMRGLIKYLIQNHADWSDDAILKAANDWKAVFFPKETVNKALKLKAVQSGGSAAIELPSQVGGC